MIVMLEMKDPQRIHRFLIDANNAGMHHVGQPISMLYSHLFLCFVVLHNRSQNTQKQALTYQCVMKTAVLQTNLY